MSGRFQNAERLLTILEAELEETYRSVTELTNKLEDKNEALENALQELQETHRQLIIKEKMAALGNLVAGVAHEINSPLRAVLSASSTMKASATKLEELLHPLEPVDGGDRRPRLVRVLAVITDSAAVSEEASQRIAKIVGALRNFARLDEAERQEADIHEGINSTLALLQHKLGDRIEVIRNYGELPRIECSPSQLNQVFMNLFLNAIQAIPENGSITVTTRVRGDTYKPKWPIREGESTRTISTAFSIRGSRPKESASVRVLASRSATR